MLLRRETASRRMRNPLEIRTLIIMATVGLLGTSTVVATAPTAYERAGVLFGGSDETSSPDSDHRLHDSGACCCFSYCWHRRRRHGVRVLAMHDDPRVIMYNVGTALLMSAWLWLGIFLAVRPFF
jgi:hypothetical protein